MADDTGREPNQAARDARDAAVHALVANAVQIALMLAITIAISKRDALTRLHLRVKQLLNEPQDARKIAHRKALNDFRREISQIEHWLNRPGGGPEQPPETPGGMYGAR